MIKTTQKSDLPCSANFSVIVYCNKTLPNAREWALKSCYMSNKDYPGNASFTIFLTNLWYFSMRYWYLRWNFLNDFSSWKAASLWQQLINQALVATFEITVMWEASCISYELRNEYTRRTQWYVAGKESEIDNVEAKIITFVIKPGWKLTYTVCDECEIKVVCQMI